MTEAATRSASGVERFRAWLPRTVDRRVRLLAWLSLASQVLIVATGGAVRLTGSGLGCPTWPLCTAESIVATPEMGIHGVIEFGNRLLTFVLIVIAAAMFLAVSQFRRERPELFRLSLALGFGIILQAVVGGFTVWLNLHPGAVGVHFMISVVLVALATVLVYRATYGPRGARNAPNGLVIATHLLTGVAAVAIYMGVLTTGAGPHAGDELSARNGLDPAIMQHLHAWPGYAMLALAVLVAVWARLAERDRTFRFSGWLIVAMLAQIAVGITQSRTGLPELLVGVHMVLACVLASLTAAVVLSLRR
ncbi:heme A synthase [Lysobacter korlensis]|uniref:Heme A synthase n=1 Tax=Lysobacter korlensis TaxID=553636 RepID=A0ABV6S2T8_9GAMM